MIVCAYKIDRNLNIWNTLNILYAYGCMMYSSCNNHLSCDAINDINNWIK